MADNLTIGLMLAGMTWMLQALGDRSQRIGERAQANGPQLDAGFSQWVASKWAIAAGLAFGLAIGCKLNGAAGLMVAGVYLMLLLVLRLLPVGIAQTPGRIILVGCLTAVIAIGLFVVTNPYFFARPTLPAAAPGFLEPKLSQMNVLQRLQFLLKHRQTANQEGAKNFPSDALLTWQARLQALVTEGLGRWSFVSGLPVRIDPQSELARKNRHALTGWVQWDRAEVIQALKPPLGWWPIPLALVVIGILVSGLLALRELEQRQPLAGLLPIVWVGVDLAILGENLLLNWDRYYISVIAWSSLLMALAIGGSGNLLVSRLVLPAPKSS
jgi:hypothetical protein